MQGEGSMLITDSSIGSKDKSLVGWREVQHLFMQTPAMIAILRGPDHTFEFVNKLYLEVTGKTRDIVGKTVKEVFPELKGQGLFELLDNIFNAGELYRINELRLDLDLKNNGTLEEMYFNLVYQPYRNKKNEVAGIIVHGIDMTNSIKARKQAENDKESLALALAAGKMGTWVIDHIDNTATHSLEHDRIFGYTRPVSNWNYDVFMRHVAEGEKDKVAQEFAQATETGELQFDCQIVRSDKKKAWIQVRGQVLYENEKPVRTAGIVMDVTEQKRTEEELRQSEENFSEQSHLTELIAQNATTSLFIMDDKQKCSFMNPSAEKMTGYTFSQIRAFNKPLHDIIHHTRPDGSKYVLTDCPIDRALPKKANTTGEDVFVKPDGSFYPVSLSASPIIRNGQPIGTIIEVKDITEEKRYAEEQKRLVEISRQRNELLEINKVKDEFIGIASHQLRTPATAVKQYIGIMIDGLAGELTEEQMAYLRIAYNSNERELKLVDELLKTAQIDAKVFRVKRRPHNLARILRNAIEDLKDTLALKGQLIAVEGVGQQVIVNLDEAEMKVALSNLLENASKYSGTGMDIKVALKVKESKAVITIKDKGVGIHHDDYDKIFDKFTRVDNELSDTVTGTGLGLYWVKQIIELHGGSVTVTSKLKVGSTFKVTLPL